MLNKYSVSDKELKNLLFFYWANLDIYKNGKGLKKSQAFKFIKQLKDLSKLASSVNIDEILEFDDVGGVFNEIQ